MSQRELMIAGDWYNCVDDELERLRQTAREALHEHNHLAPGERGAMAPLLKQLLGSAAADCRIEAPFHCAYGFNIHLGARVFINAGATLIDSAAIRIGEGSLLGPNVQIYCAEHHADPELRMAGMETARPVTIGENVWIGGGAIILAGVAIGRDAIVGAGSVVTRDVVAGTTVVGNPARPRTKST